MAEDPNYDVDIRLCFAAPAEPPHPTKKAKLSPPSTGTKRLFPGPAGLLSGALCSQNTSLPFEEPPWKEMTRYSGSLCDHFNIAWIKGQAKCNQFRIQKVPFLAGVVLCLEVDGGDGQKSVNVTLKDPTGTIRGNIVQSVYEEHKPHFTAGAVLVLVEFAVLSCSCHQCDNHHLTITNKNLSAIYGKTSLVILPISPREVLEKFQQNQQILAESNNRGLEKAAVQMKKRAQLTRIPATRQNHAKIGPRPPEEMLRKSCGEEKETCVTVADVTHEQVWKETLSDLDLKALFDENF